MDHLSALESKSIFILREAYHRFKNLAVCWSIGKDSTTLLWLCRKAFFGQIPFPAVHIDTSYKFSEIYRFRDEYAQKWNVNLIIGKNEDQLRKGMGPNTSSKMNCCNELKTNALKGIIKSHGFQALLVGIRRDEHGIRAKERYFSPRDEDFKWAYSDQAPELWDLYKSEVKDEQHLRVHPMLDWSELDVWKYIQREKIPIVQLYLAKNGKRYRSIGCETCCAPVSSNASSIRGIIKELERTSVTERAGRAQDKEDAYAMQKLRSLGYM